jgi:hypothetical protein
METEERDARGPIITHMGRAADAVASDVHKLLTFAALVRRDLVHGLGADDDAEILRAAARQLRDRADHLAALAAQLGRDRALLPLARRQATAQPVDNASLPAGSPMYYYCDSCGCSPTRSRRTGGRTHRWLPSFEPTPVDDVRSRRGS